MKKLVFIFLLVSVLSTLPLLVSADEYDRDEVFVSWKLVAYALYPAGYAIENLAVKPIHWIISLPFIKDISGHEELTKGIINEQEKEYENLEVTIH